MNDSTRQNWAMADVSAKAVTKRVAIAAGSIYLGEKATRMLLQDKLPKGNPLVMAEIAGIQAAKQTPSLLPLCHPISLNRVLLRSVIDQEEHLVTCYCIAEIAEKTGVEMEALTGLSIALLTIWDLVKPVNAALQIVDQKLLYKSGGKSGIWVHPQGLTEDAREIITEMGLQLPA